jgi:isoleucyl-tRNA synthetase
MVEEAWEHLLALRDQAMKALEEAREAGLIGDSLGAELEVTVGDERLWRLLEPRQEQFATACIVSSLKLQKKEDVHQPGEAARIQVNKAQGAKCQRCWMRLASVGKSAEHPGLCHRCEEVVQRIRKDGILKV